MSWEMMQVIPADVGRELYALLQQARESLGMSWSSGEEPDDIPGRVDNVIARYEQELSSGSSRGI